jgi:hypothetical protein
LIGILFLNIIAAPVVTIFAFRACFFFFVFFCFRDVKARREPKDAEDCFMVWVLGFGNLKVLVKIFLLLEELWPMSIMQMSIEEHSQDVSLEVMLQSKRVRPV